MRAVFTIGIGLALCLGGCHPKSDIEAPASESFGGLFHHGRYQSAGIYPVGQMWTQLIGSGIGKSPNAPSLSDDEQVLVMVDSNTGEVRQCGNVSGYCIGMKPWAASLPPEQTTPLPLLKHADDIAREAREAEERASHDKR